MVIVSPNALFAPTDTWWRLAADDIEHLDAGTGWSDASEITRPLDTHRLDVALSAGRHAVERAKLAGCVRLLGIGQPGSRDQIAINGLTRALQNGVEPYQALRRWGDFTTAALTGMAIAGAQIGVRIQLQGAGAPLAIWAATAIHPGVGRWLDDGAFGLPPCLPQHTARDALEAV